MRLPAILVDRPCPWVGGTLPSQGWAEILAGGGSQSAVCLTSQARFVASVVPVDQRGDCLGVDGSEATRSGGSVRSEPASGGPCLVSVVAVLFQPLL